MRSRGGRKDGAPLWSSCAATMRAGSSFTGNKRREEKARNRPEKGPKSAPPPRSVDLLRRTLEACSREPRISRLHGVPSSGAVHNRDPCRLRRRSDRGRSVRQPFARRCDGARKAALCRLLVDELSCITRQRWRWPQEQDLYAGPGRYRKSRGTFHKRYGNAWPRRRLLQPELVRSLRRRDPSIMGPFSTKID